MAIPRVRNSHAVAASPLLRRGDASADPNTKERLNSASTYPRNTMGGCTSIHGVFSSGFRPLPSMGVKPRVLKGLWISTTTSMKMRRTSRNS